MEMGEESCIAYVAAAVPLVASPTSQYSLQELEENTTDGSGLPFLHNPCSSVVLRRVIQDHSYSVNLNDVQDDELEFLSLCADDENEEEDVAEAELENHDELQSNIVSVPPVAEKPRSQDPPWQHVNSYRRYQMRSPLFELHREIVEFCELISPTEEEHQSRAAAVQRVSDVVRSIWKHCEVAVFGSFATGLYLPTSDVDIVVLNSGCPDIQSCLRALAKALTREGVARNVQVIGKARVPIVKFIETQSLVSFDISFDMLNGIEAAKFIKNALSSVPPLKPLCLVLKIFLQQRDLNEVYSGGIGSYALLVMILAYLQIHANKVVDERSKDQVKLEQNLGVLLVDFFELYGRSLNVKDVGISCRHGGFFFRKKDKRFYDHKKPFLLSVEDPQAPQNDISKSSYNFQKVRFAFMLAHRLLTDWDCDDFTSQASILARIIRVDDKLAERINLLPSSSRSTFSFWSQLDTQTNWFDHNGFGMEIDFPRDGVESDYEQKKGKKRKKSQEGSAYSPEKMNKKHRYRHRKRHNPKSKSNDHDH